MKQILKKNLVVFLLTISLLFINSVPLLSAAPSATWSAYKNYKINWANPGVTLGAGTEPAPDAKPASTPDIMLPAGEDFLLKVKFSTLGTKTGSCSGGSGSETYIDAQTPTVEYELPIKTAAGSKILTGNMDIHYYKEYKQTINLLYASSYYDPCYTMTTPSPPDPDDPDATPEEPQCVGASVPCCDTKKECHIVKKDFEYVAIVHLPPDTLDTPSTPYKTTIKINANRIVNIEYTKYTPFDTKESGPFDFKNIIIPVKVYTSLWNTFHLNKYLDTRTPDQLNITDNQCTP